MIIAPTPTAATGAAFPSWPTTAVSTAPNIGTVMLDSTIGIAIARTLLFVISCFKNFTLVLGLSGSNSTRFYQTVERPVASRAGYPSMTVILEAIAASIFPARFEERKRQPE